MKWVYLTIAILLIIALIVVFFVSYYFNKKTPVPKECEDLLISKENCSSCKNFNCELRNNDSKDENHKKEEE